jgi:hypothetical protein
MTLLLFYAYNVHGQIQLIDIKSSNCSQDGIGFKPIYKEIWLNDSILQIETIASANCIGVYNPRIKTFGPLLFLMFDEFDGLGHVADCVCVYQITWKIKGIKKKDKHILLLNGQISSDYNTKLLNSLLSSYYIENNKTYFYLRNAIDKNGWKQGRHEFKGQNGTSSKIYKNGIEQTNR